jgi:integrase
MASVFKPKGRTIYRVEYKDQHGKTHTKPTGLKDRGLAEGLARMIERDVERIKAGYPPKDAEATGPYLGLSSFPRLRAWGEVVQDYLNELVRQGSEVGGNHHRDSRVILTRIQKETGWSHLAQVRADDFTRFLGRLAEAGRAPRTQNRYFETLRAFLNFCVRQGWLSESPLKDARPVKVGEKGRRRLRRAYTLAELQRLLAATPEPRRRVYAVAAFSGFRRKELSKLEKQDCTPAGPRPRWHVRAEVTKNGRRADLPMTPECAEALRPIWEALPVLNSRLFPRQRRGRAATLMVPANTTVQKDLERAGIVAVDERGRHADFHSLRYFFCTQLARQQPMIVVQRLMRHGTINLTASLYTDLGLEDAGADGWILPRLLPPEVAQPTAAALPDSLPVAS